MFWYEQDVREAEARKSRTMGAKTVFYGSSTIRLWNNLEKDMSRYLPVNLGFGGATLASCVVYLERLLKGLSPEAIIIYAGDNDLGDGRHPEEVVIFFKQLVYDIRRLLGEIPLVYISIKPSIKRFSIVDQIKFTNKTIEKEIAGMDGKIYFLDLFDKILDANNFPNRLYFQADGLHINDEGYAILKKLVEAFFIEKGIGPFSKDNL